MDYVGIKKGNQLRKIFIIALIISNSVFVKPQTTHAQGRKYGIAVLDLQANNIAEAEVTALSDVLRFCIADIINERNNHLTNSYNLIERKQMDKIFDQFDIQSTGCISDSCAVEFGKMLQVDRIIIGSVNLIGSTYVVIVRIVDIETNKTLHSVGKKVVGEIDNVIDLMVVIAGELLIEERVSEIDIPHDKKKEPVNDYSYSKKSRPYYLAINYGLFKRYGKNEKLQYQMNNEIIINEYSGIFGLRCGYRINSYLTFELSTSLASSNAEAYFIKKGETESSVSSIFTRIRSANILIYLPWKGFEGQFVILGGGVIRFDEVDIGYEGHSIKMNNYGYGAEWINKSGWFFIRVEHIFYNLLEAPPKRFLNDNLYFSESKITLGIYFSIFK